MNAAHFFLQLKNYGLNIDEPSTFETAWQIPNESDIHAHLISYLASRNRAECIEAVFSAETQDGKNGWLQTRAARGETAGFVSDVVQWKNLLRVGNLADEAANEPPRWLGQEVRCILLLSTMRSSTSHAQFEIVDAPNSDYDTWFQNTWSRFDALRAIAVYLPAEQQTQVLKQALEAAQTIQQEILHSEQLATLAPILPKELLQQALQTAQGIQYENYRLMALAAIAPCLPSGMQSRVLEQILEAAPHVRTGMDRSWILVTIASSLPRVSLQPALEIARSMEAGVEQALALAAIASHLPYEQRHSVMKPALQIAQSMEGKVYWDRVLENLAFLAQAIPQDILEVGVCSGQHRQEKPHCAEFSDVAALAPYMPLSLRNRVLDQAFSAAQSIDNEYYQSTALVAILPYLPIELQNQVVEQLLNSAQSHVINSSQSIEAKEYWSGILAEIAPILPPRSVQQALDLAIKFIRQALDVKLMDRTEESRYWALAAIATQVHKPQSNLMYRILDVAALVRRESALTIIAGLATPLYEIGGVEAISGTARAIDDVCRW